ncbi:MAG: glycogen debranching enzyme family protein [Clostridia bacterium]|nr:glycogen debranching enzyme family protein [Clostridia bacterium]
MYKKWIHDEYLITNGIGGFASSSLTGANTRKYHAILNAAYNPPVSRHVLLSRVETTLAIDDREHMLESVEYENDYLDQTQYTKSFSDLPVPTFEYAVDTCLITKQIAMKYGENTSAVLYNVKTQDQAVKLKVKLFVNRRDHHDLSKENDFNYAIRIEEQTLHLTSDEHHFYVKGFGRYHEVNIWGPKEYYRIEARRGQDGIDVNFIPGYFEMNIPPYGDISFGIVASTEKIVESPEHIVSQEIHRRDKLTKDEDEIAARLQIACDHFIVDRKSTHSKTVIAGYPWFTDWGRDTMIALPGLTLSTKRYADAKDIIKTFIKYEKNGLIPNMFPDDNVEPMYNTIDGTLWLFIAVFQYYKATKDGAFIKEIWPTLDRIIKMHISGTDYNIHVDKDGLLDGGDATTQLTWMDVKIDGHVVTPRHGKAVEINALWFNALNIMDFFKTELKTKSSIDFLNYAERCYESFEKFWNEEKSCLYDLIQDGESVDRIRPNQIFAVSLPYGLLDEEQEKQIISVVEKELLTPNGLRSLSRDHEDYEPLYDGDVYKRDYAYHQGTVWGWLIGPYLEAHYNVYQDKAYVKEKLNLFLKHMEDTGIGTISEVFSGDAPHHPRGCFAQAWSVSEPLRIYRLIQN